jgi:hypothetical protein
MTAARDEAIAAVLATGIPVHKSVIDEVIRSIPPDVLVRYAVETGALVDTTFAQNPQGTVYACSRDWDPDDHGHRRLYRVAD